MFPQDMKTMANRDMTTSVYGTLNAAVRRHLHRTALLVLLVLCGGIGNEAWDVIS